MEAWIKETMDQNLRSLMLLRLAFSPKVDQDYPKLVALWTFAFTKAIGRIDQKLDEHRINKAFGDSTAILSSWPAPAEIIKLMPLRPQVKRVEYNTPASPGQAGAYFDIAMKVISGELTKEEAQDLMERV